MRDAGATQYTFHLEAADDVERCIRKIREADMKVLSCAELFSLILIIIMIFSLSGVLLLGRLGNQTKDYGRGSLSLRGSS